MLGGAAPRSRTGVHSPAHTMFGATTLGCITTLGPLGLQQKGSFLSSHKHSRGDMTKVGAERNHGQPILTLTPCQMAKQQSFKRPD